MSTVPSVLYVGANQIDMDSGIQRANDDAAEVANAGNAGKTIDTLSLNFGFYYAAQATGIGIVNGVVNHAVKSNQTTVTGGAAVAATGLGQIPALYALAYTNAAGGVSVVITNKSATAHQVTIRINGAAVTGLLPAQFVSGLDPSTANSAGAPAAVAIQTATSSNPIPVGPYSVTRVDLTAPPVASLVNSASYQATALAPQQLVTAFGTGFAAQTLEAAQQPLPLTLGDSSILVTDSAGKSQQAALFYVSPTQASFLLPSGMAPGAATLKAMRGSATVLTGSFTVAAVSPGIYSANGNGAGVAAADAERVGPEGTVPLPVFTCLTNTPLTCLSTPLALGTASDTVYLSLYGTGIRGAASVQAFVAGQPAPVAGYAAQGQYAGLDQVNITLPPSLTGTGESSVYLIVDGIASNMVTVNIQ
jgi:uncharacterized protein (TIGR03437 family)